MGVATTACRRSLAALSVDVGVTAAGLTVSGATARAAATTRAHVDQLTTGTFPAAGAKVIATPVRAVAPRRGINGTGSSFAAPAIERGATRTRRRPTTSTSTTRLVDLGTGRYEFTNQTTDFAVSDIGYGREHRHHAPELPLHLRPDHRRWHRLHVQHPRADQELQLDSYTTPAPSSPVASRTGTTRTSRPTTRGRVCPTSPIKPVTESDSAGTNYVLEEWCIDEQPALWAAFAQSAELTSPAARPTA